MAQYFWNEHYNAIYVSPFPTTWKNVAISNPYPVVGEEVTITGELWRYMGGPEDPITTGVALLYGEYETARTTLGANGRFSLTIRAPDVPGPYTYFPCVVYDLRYDGAVFPDNHGPPVGIDAQPMFVCPWCGSTFPSEALLGAHKAICPYRPAYTCPWCDAAFATEAELKAHKAICPYRPTEFVCPWCDVVFATEEELEAHKLVCPQRPTPVPWGNVLLYGSLGLIGIGLVWTTIKVIRR